MSNERKWMADERHFTYPLMRSVLYRIPSYAPLSFITPPKFSPQTLLGLIWENGWCRMKEWMAWMADETNESHTLLCALSIITHPQTEQNWTDCGVRLTLTLTPKNEKVRFWKNMILAVEQFKREKVLIRESGYLIFSLFCSVILRELWFLVTKSSCWSSIFPRGSRSTIFVVFLFQSAFCSRCSFFFFFSFFFHFYCRLC